MRAGALDGPPGHRPLAPPRRSFGSLAGQGMGRAAGSRVGMHDWRIPRLTHYAYCRYPVRVGLQSIGVAMIVSSTTGKGAVPGARADLGRWADRFEPMTFPVLAQTAAQLESLRLVEEDVDAHTLSEVLAEDPLMSLKVLAHVASLRAGREGGEPETLTGALVMLGIAPFFRDFTAQTSVEDSLAGDPDALAGFREVLRRSHRAARFAMAFAAHRMDHDAAVIHQAALLHDFAELLVWLYAPALALEVVRRQRLDPALRSSSAQRAVLGVELSDLQHHLMVRWRLPALLATITNDHTQSASAQAANVRLAIRVSRHSAAGWDNPALPDDYAEIAQLLQLAPVHVQRLLLDIDSI